jgi:uncharacterized oxidoreductase
LDISRLEVLVSGILAGNGCEPQEADEIAKRLLDANLKGHDSHGVQLVPLYLQRIQSGMIKPGQHASFIHETPNVLIAEGNFGFGQVIGREVIDRAIPKAIENGVVLVGIRKVHHLGRVGYWAEKCAKAGLVSLHFLNVTGARLVAPFGASERRLGTNPVTLGMPGPDGEVILLDMATSQVAASKISLADRRGQPAPTGSLVAEDGTLTTEANRLYKSGDAALTPLGGHKGFGLAIFCELLAGAFIGSVGNHPGNGLEGGVYNNMFSILIRTDIASPADQVMEEIARIKAWVLSARARPEMEVQLPGEPERRAAASNAEQGILVEENTWQELLSLGEAAGMPRTEIDGVLA